MKPFTYVPSQSGATVAAALAGHQGGVNATVNNPSEGLPFYQGASKKLRPLCAFTPASPKTGIYAGLATCKSQGLGRAVAYGVRWRRPARRLKRKSPRPDPDHQFRRSRDGSRLCAAGARQVDMARRTTNLPHACRSGRQGRHYGHPGERP